MHRFQKTMILAVGIALALGGMARADAPFGPKVGSAAPQIGRLHDQTDKARSFPTLAGSKGTVLIFFRSASWCPYCQAQLIAMNEGAAEIEKRGYKIVGVSYEEPALNKAFTERRGITYTLLSDPGSVTIDRWNLRDPAYPASSRAYGVARPIILVIDRKGVIRGSLAEETYKTRPPVAEVLKVIDGLK